MTRWDVVLLLLLGAVWGSVFPLAAIALHDLAPQAVIVIRTGLSALLLLPFALHRGALLREARRRPGALLTASLIQLTIPVVLLTLGQQHVSAGLAGILLGSQPVWATVLSAALERRLHTGAVGGVLLGLAGVVLLFWRDLGTSPAAPLGGVMLVAAAAGYAAGALYIQRVLPEVPPVTTAAVAMTVSSLLLAPALALTTVQRPPLATAGWVLLLATVSTGGALALFYTLITRVGVVRANLAAYLAPGFALLYDIPLGHLPTPTALTGLALVLTGSAIAARAPDPGSALKRGIRNAG